MKKILLKTLIVCAVVFLFPFVLTLLISNHPSKSSSEIVDFTIYYEVNGSRDKLTFENYLLGVVAANMPASYELEALKAQAVIARTYALYNISHLTEKNPEQKTFTTSELGLAYISLNDLSKLWDNEDYNTYLSRLENAVYATEGEVLLYEDTLILPVFFNTGSGSTRNASEAWGIEIPYLLSVPSKQDVTSINYLKILEYSVSDILDLLIKYYPNLSVTKDNFFENITVITRDSANYVLEMKLGDLTVSGEEFAKVLSLPSNHFYIENYEGNVRIICNGAGHGVGLSQYGANAMAEEGSSFEDILKYYYTGVDFATIKGEN